LNLLVGGTRLCGDQFLEVTDCICGEAFDPDWNISTIIFCCSLLSEEINTFSAHSVIGDDFYHSRVTWSDHQLLNL
jgi:hypothetical protein